MRFLPILLLLSLVGNGQNKLTKWVNPFVGTAGHGHTFPGATIPFGMVQLSPDTRIDGSWDGCSGYHYSDSIIYGFSHTHLSGTGCSDYGDIMLMPMTGTPSFDSKKYAAGFQHRNEKASPGYYSVKLNNGIHAELTTTTRTGWHLYHFPEGKKSVILDLRHRDELQDGSIKIINDSTVWVKRISKAWAQEQHAYASIIFSSPFRHSYNRDSSKLMIEFDMPPKQSLLIKVGYSMVSEEGADNNLRTEAAGMNFNSVKMLAVKTWERELGKIVVNDSSAEKMKTFYTALYHVMIHPNIAMDVDGRYRGRDNRIHQAEGFTYYTVFSLWDTFRALHPLLTLIDRKRTLDFIRTFLAQYRDGGRLPVWELSSNETDCMIGYHSVPVITDAYMKGIRDFDLNLALEAMKKSANWNHFGLPAYRQQGFLMMDDESESVSKTLEYAYDDWCIYRMAIEAGETETAKEFYLRSNAWKNLLDPSTLFMRPRKNGGWLQPFEPREVNNHFTEGNSWQYSFFVPHDIIGLNAAMGGKYAFEAKLDSLFNASSATTGRTQADITGLIGQYAHGNEPSHHMAYLYNYVGKPEKAKKRIHQILKTFYHSGPDGLIGNEDCGQMSAWYVFSAMGLYPVTPGTNLYALTEPYLSDYTVFLENGRKLKASDINEAYQNRKVYLTHDRITGEKMEEKSNTSLELPQYIPAPVIHSPSMSFDDSLRIRFEPAPGTITYYQLQSADGKAGEWKNDSAIWISQNQTVTAVNRSMAGEASSLPVTARFFRNPHPDWNVNLLSTYNPQYSAGGPRGIIDGIKGSVDWRKGEWQGYQGQDFEVIIDMRKTMPIREFHGSFLQDTRSWILMPKQVEYSVSVDGEHFKTAGMVFNTKLEYSESADGKNVNSEEVAFDTVDPKDYEIRIRNFDLQLTAPVEARYVKAKAVNFGKLPDWHAGAGFEAFIFVDEIDIK